MGIVLGDNRYGKAEVRLVRVDRDGELHRLTDLTVSVALAGDLDAVHLSGDNAQAMLDDPVYKDNVQKLVQRTRRFEETRE